MKTRMKRLLLVAVLAVSSVGPAKTATPKPAPSPSPSLSRTGVPRRTPTAAVTSRPIPYPGNRILYLASSGTFDNGSSANAPLDGGTQSKYDAIVHQYQQNTTFYYAAGTYLTNGTPAGAGCQDFGVGIDKTILRMNPSGCGLIFSGSNTNGFQAWNMTLDCNANSGAGCGYSSAANLVGSNLLFKYLKVIEYGTKTGTECFVLCSAPSGTNEPANSQFSHVHVENCQSPSQPPAIPMASAWSILAPTPKGDPASKVVQVGCCTESWKVERTVDAPGRLGCLIFNKKRFFVDCQSGVLVAAHPNGAVGPLTVTGNSFVFTNGKNAGEVAVALITSIGSFGDIPVVTSVTITNNKLAGANGGIVYYGLANIGGSNPGLQGGVATLTLTGNTVNVASSSNS